MGFRLTPSPMYTKDPSRRMEETFRVNILYGDDSRDRFGSAYGPTAEIARMRAELICMAVNDRPALQEYEAIKSKEEVV